MGMNRITLSDVAAHLDPKGNLSKIVDPLVQSNPIVQDAPAIAANAPMGNRVTIRSTLPTVAYGKINQGVTRSKGTVRQDVDSIGILVALSEVDARLEKIHGSSKFNGVRWEQDKGFLEAATQQVASTLISGDIGVDESAFTGFLPRLASLATAITGSQVRAHHAAPSGSDYTSLLVVDWHPDYVSLIYPEGSAAGIQNEDLGKMLVYDKDGTSSFPAYVMEYTWMLGLTVKDARHIARLCNIDVSQALTDSTTLLTNSLIRLMNGMPPRNTAQRVIYCSRNILTALELQIQSRSNVLFKWDEYLGEKTLFFKGAPFRMCDQMSEAESLVS
jgi:hypothetical protein